jgi:serine/threonine protein kinase
MGHSVSKPTAPKQTFTPEVEIINKHQSSQLGDALLVKDKKTGQEMYRQNIFTQDKESYEAQLAYYHGRVNKPHPNLVNVIGYTSEEHSMCCSQTYTISLYLDSLYQTMKTELELHTKTGHYISEVELQLLCQNMTTILAEFQKQGIYHGEISPSTIFITEEAYKLCDPTFNGQKSANGAVKYLLLGVKSLMAPELLRQIPIQDFELRTNKYKADVYSLGATLLSLATLTNSEDLYDYENGTINYKLLDTRIQKVESIYSPTFASLLKELLTADETHRPDFVQLNEKLNITDHLRSYNHSHPVSSYAKDPLVKIATKLDGQYASPIVYPGQEVHVQAVKDVKNVDVHSPDSFRSSVATGLTQSNYNSPNKAVAH